MRIGLWLPKGRRKLGQRKVEVWTEAGGSLGRGKEVVDKGYERGR